MRLTFNQPSFETPTLVGKPLDEAIFILSQHDLNIRVIATKEENQTKPGTIMSQSPAPQSKIKKRQTVYCVLARPADPQQAPRLLGKSQTAIQPILDQRSIQAKIYYVDTHAPQGTCIAQHPTPGAPLHQPTMILYLSHGIRKPFIWPTFTGKSVEDARLCLQKQGIEPTITHRIPVPESHQCDHCMVVDQRPHAGTLITITKEKKPTVHLQVDIAA